MIGDMAEHLTIGEFARRSWLSAKALRLYDAKGVLVPQEVDPRTGYRRYAADQLDVARLVVLLRRIEMPLNEITVVLATAPEDRTELVSAYWAGREVEHARQRSLADFLARAVSEQRLDGYGVSNATTYEVMVREVGPQNVITRRGAVTAGELTDFIRSSVDDLITHIGGPDEIAGPMFVIYHGEVSWESDGPIEMCVPVANVERAHRVEAGHGECYVRVPKSRLQFPGILEAFEAVRAWPAAHGQEAFGPPREVYSSDYENADPEDIVCEVALPIAASGGPPL